MAPTNPSPFSPEFWRALSQEQRDRATARAMEPGAWERAAANYDDLERCEDYLRQVEGVMGALVTRSILHPGARVLDVGCGTGTYTIRMAPLVEEVVALDSSPAMLEVLRSKVRQAGIRNVKVVEADWREYRPSHPFDLVFASMTPIFRRLELVDKLLAASSRHLVLVTWAGIKENPLLHRLFLEILGRDPQAGDRRPDMFLLFNYLYTLGYAPDLRFFHGCWRRRRPKERQVEHLLWQLELHTPLTPEQKRRVEEVVEEAAPGPEVEVVTRVRTCLMVVDKALRDHRCP